MGWLNLAGEWGTGMLAGLLDISLGRLEDFQGSYSTYTKDTLLKIIICIMSFLFLKPCNGNSYLFYLEYKTKSSSELHKTLYDVNLLTSLDSSAITFPLTLCSMTFLFLEQSGYLPSHGLCPGCFLCPEHFPQKSTSWIPTFFKSLI
jgi:hypothetical protein